MSETGSWTMYERLLVLPEALGAELLLACPYCGPEPNDYVHILGLQQYTPSDDYPAGGRGRGTLIKIAFACEVGGHRFLVCFNFHKGQTLVWSERDAR